MMKRHSVAIAFLLLMIPLSGIISTAATPDDITIDGDLSEWDSDTFIDTSSSAVPAFRMTWNDTHLFIAWHGTDWSSISEGADFFIYLNTTSGGSPLSMDWNTVHTLPFSADFAFVLEDSSYFSLLTHDGVEWIDADQTGVAAYVGWSGNNNTEIAIPWSNIGSPISLEIFVWSQWQDEGNVWISFPPENPASNDGAETFTYAYVIADRTVEQTPGYLPAVDFSGTVEKMDNALNLAIVFHQHQPYYRNVLTGMYEMPWVRVHAMTEYVDSPGILEKYPDTKVTYNLVPSFMEQLLDYHRNETLDVHTDIAKRPWPEGDYPNATDLELHTMQFQSFWNSGWIYNVSDDDPSAWVKPSSGRYLELHGRTMHNLKPATIMDDALLPPQEFLDLQVLWYLYQFSPDYVLGSYDASHRDEGLIALFQQNGNYSHEDLMYVVDAQHEHMGNVLPMYSDLAASGQVELSTTPYYHPIMPLLMMDGWTFEDGIRVNKDSWEDDTRHQLNSGMDLFEEEMGFRPVGMWPSEEAVSPAMVQPVSDVGIEWMITDEELLMKSTDLSGNNVDVNDAANLAMPWVATGVDGGEVAVIFRDRVISDRVAWQYGSMTPEDAVTDFISYIDGIRQQLLDAGEDPSEHMLTVSMDGENWMFMSEFQHNDNGRPFVDEWFSRLGSHPTIKTTTPSEFLSEDRDLPQIDTIGTGSWVDGTLSTWAGEEEESLAWQRLVEARDALVDFESSNPNHSGLDAAWESVYIAEGSDWYWWYGLDQDSGYDEMWDVLFKVHLSNIYRAVDLELPPYLQELWTNPALPIEPYGNTIEPMIDGIALPGEWDGAALYDAPVDGGELDITSFHLGYDSNNVYVRVDTEDAPSLTGEKAIEIYFMQPNAVNFNEAETNFRTQQGKEILGFPAKRMVSFDFDELRDDGRSKWNLYSAKGKIAGQERWTSSTSSGLGGCAFDEVHEFAIPWSDLGLAPGYSTRVKVVTAFSDTMIDLEMAPPAPAEMILPDLEEWVTILDIDDAIGDETGDGDYTYPQASDFAPGVGLFDANHLQIEQSDWNARFTITMEEITDYWSLSNGFSHQIVQIYVDRGETENGRTSMLPGVNAEVHPDWAWEVAISGTGEPGAVLSVDAATGATSSRGIEVEGDSEANTITLTISKDVIGSNLASYRYIVIIGSQDGFGTGKWRDVDETAKTWTMGGGADPSAADGLDYDPNIVDIILEDDSQTDMLSNYDVDNQQFVQLTGFGIPELAQQIYGAQVAAITHNSALITWSTTKIDAGIIDCGDGISAGGQYDDTLSHSLSVEGLQSNQSYSCSISVDNATPVDVSFITSTDADMVAPQILNILTITDEAGMTTISWFTDEDTIAHISIGSDTTGTDPLGKNHALSFDLCVGSHSATITAVDPSGNSASIDHTFTVEGDWQACSTSPGNSGDNGMVGSDDQASFLNNTTIQVVVLIVVLLIFGALIRTRKQEFE